jgi:hypothetical protein
MTLAPVLRGTVQTAGGQKRYPAWGFALAARRGKTKKWRTYLWVDFSVPQCSIEQNGKQSTRPFCACLPLALLNRQDFTQHVAAAPVITDVTVDAPFRCPFADSHRGQIR